MMRHLGIVAALACLLGPGGGGAAWAQENKPPRPKITFTKEFPGSYPAYFSVAVTEEGTTTYSTAPDDSQPLHFRLSQPVVRRIFQLAASLNHFQDVRLETRKKVAAMGKKTLRYEAGAQAHHVSFNYTENPDALALANLFEKISVTEQHLLSLEHLMRFDKLGVMKQLLQIEIAMNKGDLVEPVQFIALLEEIAGNAKFLHIAQERAAWLLERIRKGPDTANLAPAQSR